MKMRVSKLFGFALVTVLFLVLGEEAKALGYSLSAPGTKLTVVEKVYNRSIGGRATMGGEEDRMVLNSNCQYFHILVDAETARGGHRELGFVNADGSNSNKDYEVKYEGSPLCDEEDIDKCCTFWCYMCDKGLCVMFEGHQKDLELDGHVVITSSDGSQAKIPAKGIVKGY